MLKNIFLDLDDTILNFTAGEAKALSQTLREAGIEPTEAILDRYHIINTAHWELLEEGRLTRDEVLVQRFEQLSRELGVDHSGKVISERYEVLLSCQHDFMPGAEQLLKDLSSRYDLYLASNGAAAVQNPRLDDAGLRPYFKGIFISEEMGADKPSKAFFDACFAAIPGFPRCWITASTVLNSRRRRRKPRRTRRWSKSKRPASRSTLTPTTSTPS